MKNKTYLTSSLREIKDFKYQILSIVLIIFLGTLLFVGIKSTGPIANKSGSDYLKQYHLSDMNIQGSSGFTQKDIEAVEANKSIEAELGYSFSYELPQTKKVVQIFSFDPLNDQNQLLVTKGKLPKQNNEIVLDDKAQKLGYSIGDTIEINQKDVLKDSVFNIVGFVQSPMFINKTDRGITTIGDGDISFFANIPRTDFIPTVYTNLYLKFENTKNLDSYSQEYQESMSENKKVVEDIYTDRAKNRLDELKAGGSSQLEPVRNNITKVQNSINSINDQIKKGEKNLEKQKKAAKKLKGVKKAAANKKIKAAQKKLQQTKKKLQKKKAPLESKKRSLNTTLNNEMKKVNTIALPTYYFNCRAENVSYQEYGDLFDRIARIGNIFPVFFFLIAALITFSSIYRIVDENRREIGLLKALGYTKKEIALKYIMLALFSSLIGVLLGSIAGTIMIPSIVYHLSSSNFNMNFLHISFQMVPILQALIVFLIACFGSVMLVLIPAFSENPSILFRPKAPKPGKRVFLENISPVWSRLSFNQKVSWRNLLRYKSRFIMGVLGVAGCTGLMIAGFGINDSIKSVENKQFNEISNYQAIVVFNTTAHEEASKILTAQPSFSKSTAVFFENYKYQEKGNATQNVSVIVPDDASKINDYMTLNSLKGKKIPFDTGGAIISQRLAEAAGVKVGQTLALLNGTTPFSFIVSGIYQNYIGHFVFLTKSYYEQVEKKAFVPNAELVQTQKMKPIDENILKLNLLGTKQVKNVTLVSSEKEKISNSLGNLDSIVVIFIVLSGALAFVVLYNITSINLSERIRELSTLKVLGFYNKEVTMFIVRENIIFSIIGIVLGYFFGYFLTGLIVSQANMDELMFPHIVHLSAYVISTIFTLFFTFLVLLVAHNELKKIDMIESLKSVE